MGIAGSLITRSATSRAPGCQRDWSERAHNTGWYPTGAQWRRQAVFSLTIPTIGIIRESAGSEPVAVVVLRHRATEAKAPTSGTTRAGAAAAPKRDERTEVPRDLVRCRCCLRTGPARGRPPPDEWLAAVEKGPSGPTRQLLGNGDASCRKETGHGRAQMTDNRAPTALATSNDLEPAPPHASRVGFLECRGTNQRTPYSACPSFSVRSS